MISMLSTRSVFFHTFYIKILVVAERQVTQPNAAKKGHTQPSRSHTQNTFLSLFLLISRLVSHLPCGRVGIFNYHALPLGFRFRRQNRCYFEGWFPDNAFFNTRPRLCVYMCVFIFSPPGSGLLAAVMRSENRSVPVSALHLLCCLRGRTGTDGGRAGLVNKAALSLS